MRPDDPVRGDEALLRRVLASQLEWHDDFGRYIPALAALSFDPDGLSVSREEVLDRLGFDASALLDRPGLVFRSRAHWWREHGAGVVPDPNGDSVIGAAHALIKPPQGHRKLGRRARTEIAAMMERAAGAPPPPPATSGF